jgi:hypothetical protein
MSIQLLKKYIRDILKEDFYIRNALSPATSEREQLGRISAKDMDDELAPHLSEPDVTPEECWGPVPPTSEKPGVHADAWAKDHSPLPTPSIKR